MFVEKNDLASLKNYFTNKLPNFSSSEINSIVKQLVIKRLDIEESDYIFSSSILFSESDLLYFRGVVKRLEINEPFQHVIGEVEFYGLILKSDARALVPRPETEELVDWVVSDYKGQPKVKFMDLCAGSGCIALGIKSEFSDAELTAVELSKEAVSLIEENIKGANLDIDILQADVLNIDSFSSFEKASFDCWVSNPPYIPNEDKKVMHPNVLDYEPGMALFVEDDSPFIFYDEIAKSAKTYLVEGGCLYFEIHESYGPKIVSLLRDLDFVNIELRKDLQGRYRMIKAQKVSSRNEPKSGEN